MYTHISTAGFEKGGGHMIKIQNISRSYNCKKPNSATAMWSWKRTWAPYDSTADWHVDLSLWDSEERIQAQQGLEPMEQCVNKWMLFYGIKW